MNQLFEQFTAFFEKRGWAFQQYGDKPVLHTHFVGQQGQWQGVAVAREEDDAIAFLSIFPSRVPVARRAACAELLTRLNYRLRHGSFQMDLDDGEIQFATSLMLPTKEATAEQVEHLVMINVCTMDDRYDTLMKVVHGGMAPKVAVALKDLPEKKAKAAKTLTKKRRFELN
jgi:hypothetical protein